MDRRSFLKTTAAAAASVSTAGCLGGVSDGPLFVQDRYLTLTPVDGDVAASSLQNQQNPENVMQEKVNQATETLQRQGLGTEVYEAAIAEGMEGLFLSNLAALPTAGEDLTNELFSTWLNLEQNFEKALDVHITEIGTEQSTTAAINGRNFLQVTTEAIQVIGQHTAQCDPTNPEQCDLINQTDDPGADKKERAQANTIVDVEQFQGFQRQVRSPFFFGAGIFGTTSVPEEEVITTDSLWPGQCAVTTKETRGVKAIVRPIRLPIWVEPWRARARIVGFRPIWVWEFVPAEFLKTITYCNVKNGGVTTEVETAIIPERKLMHFWRFFPTN